MSADYPAAAHLLLRETGCTVRRFRKSNTGIAYTNDDDWGIEVPTPRGPISFGTFAHEVGHQVLHRHGARPRWLEELEAWEYALAQFERFQLPGVDQARDDAAKSLVYAAVKAHRRQLSAENLALMLARYPDWVWEASNCEQLPYELVVLTAARSRESLRFEAEKTPGRELV